MMAFLRKKFLFIFLLPLFFVFNGYRDNYPLVPVMDCLKLVSVYIFFSLAFYFIFWWLFKNKTKAAIAGFVIMFIQFFFGSIHDLIKNFFGESFPSRYSVILPVLAILLLVFFILLKKKQWSFTRTIFYLNLLLLLLITVDIVNLTLVIQKNRKQKLVAGELSYRVCTDCEKPDVYLVVADGYSGNETLDSVFHFNNNEFSAALQQRGFYIVPRSSSNYNFTTYSVGSALNMDYITGIYKNYNNKQDVKTCYKVIKGSRVIKFFTDHGYRFYNYSLFDFTGQPSHARESFIPQSVSLITSQTFTRRIMKDLGFHLLSKTGLKSFEKKIIYRDLNTNEKFIGLTQTAAANKDGKPKFVYTHLMMPHFPYYYTKDGVVNDWEKLTEFTGDKDKYVQYVQYSNKVFLKLVDSIMASSPKPPIIVFMGDHGFREYPYRVPNGVYCNNFNAVLLPQKNYSGFYEGMSVVNEFRVILNTAFKQNFSMLADSTIFINNK